MDDNNNKIQVRERSKPSVKDRVNGIFTEDDIKDVEYRIKNELLFPGLRDIGASIFYTIIDFIFYPQGRGSTAPRRPNMPGNQTPYHRAYSQPVQNQPKTDGYRWDNVTSRSRDEIQDIYNQMVDKIFKRLFLIIYNIVGEVYIISQGNYGSRT